MGELPSHDFAQGYTIQLKQIKTAVSAKQIDKFKETAREVETDDREETFDRHLKRVVKLPTKNDTHKGDK